MPVALLPPVTSSFGDWSGRQPLTTAPRYARGRGNSRWHRIRSGTRFPARGDWDAYTVYNWWCGQSAFDGGKRGPLWLTDELPPDDPACGTCVGRALGAGQDAVPANLPPLRFDPRWTTPPAVCPGSQRQDLVEPLDGRCKVGRCLACGIVDTIRGLGRGYSAYGYGLVKHEPGPGLYEPCPFHAWLRPSLRGGDVGCGCGWPGEPGGVAA